MVKASELRIGNWVYLFGDAVQLTKEHLIYLLQKDGEPEPIPLTEEWFLKAGFEHSRPLGIDTGVYIKKDYRIGRDGDDFIEQQFSVPFDGKILKVKYVHHLQNLWFAVDGEELEFK